VSRALELAAIADAVRGCTACDLHRTRQRAVPGDGPVDAEILFIGEGPGWNENQQGRPFVGAAGKLLEELLGSIDMKRDDVFITNVVKCWPPGNRDPLPAEVTACGDYLAGQLALIDPLLIVTLGRHSMARFIKGAMISRVHGTATEVDGRHVFAMYHPAAALHQQALRQTLFDDMLRIPPLLADLRQRRAARASAEDAPVHQLSLF
jgi:DNA polymerase